MMLYTVETQIIGEDIATAMNAMRTWLDRHRFEPDSFRQSKGGLGTTFRIDFKSEAEATAFAQAFAGRFLGSEVVRPLQEGRLWHRPQ
jgi:nitrous oxide reductase accessory protein NosL